jgi:thiamine-phosphate diphosphorylase
MLVTDRKQCGGRSLPEVVAQAVAGGVNVVQLRENDLPAADLLTLARQLRGVTGPDALLVINDRVDVALLSGADGVHLGGHGLPVSAVRSLIPPSLYVGRSVHTVRDARQAELDGADYLVAGTIFASPSHPDVVPSGPGFLRDLSARIRLPVIAIGGITAENAGECWSAGASGIACISALLRAPDPLRAAASLAPVPEELPEERRETEPER